MRNKEYSDMSVINGMNIFLQICSKLNDIYGELNFYNECITFSDDNITYSISIKNNLNNNYVGLDNNFYISIEAISKDNLQYIYQDEISDYVFINTSSLSPDILISKLAKIKYTIEEYEESNLNSINFDVNFDDEDEE